jgi:hypothetical protein
MESDDYPRCVINLGMYSVERHTEPYLFDRLREYWTALPAILGPDVRRELIIPANHRTEPTLIASGVLVKGYAARLNALLSWTKQDCCAVFFPDQRSGCLIGPKASTWGEFNFDNFHLPSGYDYA